MASQSIDLNLFWLEEDGATSLRFASTYNYPARKCHQFRLVSAAA
jgi:hypothetical protein